MLSMMKSQWREKRYVNILILRFINFFFLYSLMVQVGFSGRGGRWKGSTSYLIRSRARETEKDVQPKALKVRRNLWSLCYMTLLSLFFLSGSPIQIYLAGYLRQNSFNFFFPFKLQAFVLGQIIIISSSGLLKNLLIPSTMVKACFFFFRWYQRMKKKNNIFIHVELP